MDYSFNAEIARIYGVDEAVFVHNLYWWIAKNEANGRHYYDGRTWTYNTVKAFADLFPFWSEKQIARIIHKLRDNGALHVGNYNESKRDRTQWYALDESVTKVYRNGYFAHPETGTCIPQNGRLETPKWSLPIDQTDDCIIGTDIKPDSKPVMKSPLPPYDDFDPLNEAIYAFIEHRKRIRAPMTDHAIELLINRLRKLTADKDEQIKILERSIMNGWRGIFALKEEPMPGERKQSRRAASYDLDQYMREAVRRPIHYEKGGKQHGGG